MFSFVFFFLFILLLLCLFLRLLLLLIIIIIIIIIQNKLKHNIRKINQNFRHGMISSYNGSLNLNLLHQYSLMVQPLAIVLFNKTILSAVATLHIHLYCKSKISYSKFKISDVTITNTIFQLKTSNETTCYVTWALF